MAAHFERMWEFEGWANRRALESIGQLSDKAECLRLFGHILAAQRAWLTRLDGDKLRELGRTLTSKYNIYTATSGHRDYVGMRVTPSVYSTTAEVDYFAAAVETELRKA